MSAPERRILRDQKARDLIVSALDRNVMVLAGAGAGKTHALVERMVAAVRTGAVPVEHMAAITFTRKAAGEMRGRFLLRLRKEADQAAGEEARRVRDALDKIDQCFIGTIHSFCGRLLRERPLESGLPPDFKEVEPREEAVLRREAWNRFVQERFASNDERLEELESFGIYPEDLYAFFGRRCAFSELPLKRTSTLRPDLTSAVEKVLLLLETLSLRMPKRPEKRDKLMEALRRARHFIDNHGLRDDRDRATLLKFFSGQLKVTLTYWAPQKDFAKHVRDDLLPRFQEQVIDPALRLWRESAYTLVADFVDDAVAYFDRMRQDRGMMTFQDLLIRTAALLRRSPEVRSYFQMRYESLLVDEFQDTDPIQAEILLYLTGADVREEDWRKSRPRPGSLFLVGDDKQSIYRFRRADVDTFRFVRSRIEATGGEVVNLNTSFRSYGNLCTWISESFPAIFAAPSEPYQARFSPLHDFRDSGDDPFCVRKISIPKVDWGRREEVIAADSVRIGNFIDSAIRGATSLNGGTLLGSEASPGDFLILTRTSKQLSVYARALEERGIPFDIVGGGRLGDAAELATLVTILEAVYAPDNALPYLAYLRGGLVGLADDELYAFKKAGGRFNYKSRLPENLERELAARIRSAVEILEYSEEVLSTRPPAAAIECILEKTGLLAFAAVHPDGRSSSRAGNLLRLLSLIRRHEEAGLHWGEILKDLRELISDTEYNVEEMTLETGREDVVRLMNLHQAKGLQAKVVFLADPSDTSPYRFDPDVHVARSQGEPYLSVIVKKAKGERGFEVLAQPEGWAEDQEEEAAYQAAEEIRLLYVAATRAENLLVVSRYEGSDDSGPWHRLYRYLHDVPELPDCPSVPSNRNGAGAIDWRAVRSGLQRRKDAAAVPSYTLRQVSASEAEEEVAFGAKEGRGRTYGEVIHRLFEQAVQGRLPADESEYVRKIVLEAGLDARLAGDAVQALGRFRTSQLWHEISEAERVYTEVPLGVSEASGVARGVIDLVYRLYGKWKIVDYKTDAAATPAEAEHLVRRYETQIRSYADFWTGVTGEPVESAELWLVHGPARETQLALF